MQRLQGKEFQDWINKYKGRIKILSSKISTNGNILIYLGRFYNQKKPSIFHWLNNDEKEIFKKGEYELENYYNKESNEPTRKQLDFIESIEEYGVQVPKFIGKTKQEASEYISKYKDMLELGSMNDMQLHYM